MNIFTMLANFVTPHQLLRHYIFTIYIYPTIIYLFITSHHPLQLKTYSFDL
jgi:hypothetical protein